jgi:isoleucyl-tRNA synthetase
MFNLKDETIPKREEKILDFWEKEKIFEKSVEMRKNCPLFSFYDGPPFATGLPHYGHILAGTIKDVIPRYKTMKGFYAPRRFGWDCHGLPVENEIEKAKELSGTSAIEKFGIANFNEECRSIVLRYTSEWKKTVERFGRWVDFSNTYRTMDKSFMESVWWVFDELWKKDLVYEGFKVMPFSAQLGTPLSNFEANLNYREVDDPSITVAFELLEEPNTFFLAWTTTPWTLISNLALTVGLDLDYVKIKDKATSRHYFIGKARVSQYFKDPTTYEVISTCKGEDLVGKTYAPLFPYFADKRADGAFRVIADDFVSTEEGTGIVHTAPAFGEVDFYACKKAKIELVCPVDNNGRFTKEVPDFEGQLVKDADKQIIRMLKERGHIVQHGQIRHRYPFCWRSDTPLIYKAVRTWFVAVEKIKEDLIDANKEIHWVPDHIKFGRFGNWLENARDWAISRNRYWGCPIPIWRNEKGDIVVIKNVEDLEKRTNEKITDLHRHFIDNLTFKIDGEVYKRIPEVFDCWFESGSMPYAQNHYPFENKKVTEEGFPADFIAEGLDQTRGWFYTLNVLSAAIFKKPAFKNVIVNGIILAEDGNKMSKRLKNYPEPTEVVDKYGADAVRLYMLHSPAVRAEDLSFSSAGVELILRQVLIPMWNSFCFLSTYARIYKWEPSKKENKKNNIDEWILSLLQKVISDVDEGLFKYEIDKAIDPIVTFVDQLTNWYIRRSRTRFWSDEDTPDRRAAFETLYEVLITLAKITAPFVPFISESIYQELKTNQMLSSVHLCDFPKENKNLRNEKLEKEMDFVQRAVSIGHALRKEQKIKVRQPLSKAHLVAANEEILKILEKQKELIEEELNVKEIHFHNDESKFVELSVKPNFRLLGKKVGQHMPKVQKMILGFTQAELNDLKKGKSVTIKVEEESFEITPEEVEVNRKSKEGIIAGNDQDLAIALDIHLTPDLLLEGLAREIVNKINTMRRELKFDVSDRIKVTIDSTDKVKECFKKYKSYITGEILAVEVNFGPCEGTEWDLNGEMTIIAIQKA